MFKRFTEAPLSQQIAAVAACLCLLVSLVLTLLGAMSSQHMQRQLQAQFGRALAAQVAGQIGHALETGDLLSVRASLQRFVETTAAEQVAIIDVEGRPLGEAGEPVGQYLRQYRAPVRIASNIAGEAVVTTSTDTASAAHQRFVLSLLGLSVVLSLAVYGAALQAGRILGNRITRLSHSLALEDDSSPAEPGNEIARLEQQVRALPLELLRTRDQGSAGEEHYRDTAVLYLRLESLTGYVDTLDERSLQRYIEFLHRLVYTAAGFYGGELHVVRQFALAVYFTGPGKGGSSAFRAASCAWLVQTAARELAHTHPLSMKFCLAVALSELGIGDEADIYPGLYIQHTLDELQRVCASRPPKILLSPAVCADTDVDGRLQHQATEVMDYAMLVGFAGPYDDLLERQLQLILKRLAKPAAP